MEKRAECTHDDAARLPEGAYAAPIGRCQCCGFLFMYIGSGSWGGGEMGSGQVSTDLCSPDPNLCPPCGGRPMVLKTRNGEVIEYQPGSHGPATADEAHTYTPPAPDLALAE